MVRIVNETLNETIGYERGWNKEIRNSGRISPWKRDEEILLED
jgi:hypothetical protein